MFGSQKFISRFFIFICILICACTTKGSDDEEEKYKSLTKTPRSQTTTPRPMDTAGSIPLKEQEQADLNRGLAYLTRINVPQTWKTMGTLVVSALVVDLTSMTVFVPGASIGLNCSGIITEERIPARTPSYTLTLLALTVPPMTIKACVWAQRLSGTFHGMAYDTFSWCCKMRVPKAREVVEEITRRDLPKWMSVLYRSTQSHEFWYWSNIGTGTMMMIEVKYGVVVQVLFAASLLTLIAPTFIHPTNRADQVIIPSCCGKKSDTELKLEKLMRGLEYTADVIKFYGPVKLVRNMGDVYNTLTKANPISSDSLISDTTSTTPTELPNKEQYILAIEAALGVQQELPRYMKLWNRGRDWISGGVSSALQVAHVVPSASLMYFVPKWIGLQFGVPPHIADIIAAALCAEFCITLSPVTIALKERLLVKNAVSRWLDWFHKPTRVVGGRGVLGAAKSVVSRSAPVLGYTVAFTSTVLPTYCFLQGKIYGETAGIDNPALRTAASVPTLAVLLSVAGEKFSDAFGSMLNWGFRGCPIPLPRLSYFPRLPRKLRLCFCCSSEEFELEEQVLETLDRNRETINALKNLSPKYQEGVVSQINLDTYAIETYQLVPSE